MFAVAVLGLDDVATVVLESVVLDIVAVLGDVAAGFIAGSVVGSAPDCLTAGSPPAFSPDPHCEHVAVRVPVPQSVRLPHTSMPHSVMSASGACDSVTEFCPASVNTRSPSAPMASPA